MQNINPSSRKSIFAAVFLLLLTTSLTCALVIAWTGLDRGYIQSDTQADPPRRLIVSVDKQVDEAAQERAKLQAENAILKQDLAASEHKRRTLEKTTATAIEKANESVAQARKERAEIGQDLEQALARVQALTQEVKQLQTALTAAKNKPAAAQEQPAKIQALQARIAKQQAELTAAQAELAQAQATMATLSNAQQVMARTNAAKDDRINQMAEVIQNQLATLGELQKQNADLSRTMIQQKADNRRLTETYLRTTEENKALIQKVAEIEAKIKQLLAERQAERPDDKPEDEDPAPKGPPIKGSVVNIAKAADDLTLVEINRGTRDGVKIGMQFTVYRGDQFLGTIEITTVDQTASVGKLTLGGGLKDGDSVRSGR